MIAGYLEKIYPTILLGISIGLAIAPLLNFISRIPLISKILDKIRFQKQENVRIMFYNERWHNIHEFTEKRILQAKKVELLIIRAGEWDTNKKLL